MNVSNYSQYDIALYRKKLQLSLNTQKRAKAIIMDAQQAGLTARKTPESLIAAALYIACILEDERRTQSQISQATGVSPHTIQIRYKQLVYDLKIQSASS
ncbi:MAG: hypothetical protein ACFFDU_07860 [Candidatus Thorarchaeota archaeon]